MSSWNETWKKWKKSHFMRFGLPFLTLVIGGSFLTVDFQKIKYDAKRSKLDRKLLEEYGIDKIDLRVELQKISEANRNHEWRNVRGPRVYEDNVEFMSLREAQEKNLRDALERGERAVQKTSSENVI